MLFTREFTMLVNAAPTIMPTAKSIALPFMANALNSSKNFFML